MLELSKSRLNMSKWLVQKNFSKKLKLRNPILLEGLPGIGNVGKIAIDYLIDNLKPELLYKIHSHMFPHSVFLNEDNCIELPSVSIYNYKGKERDILLLTGDVQPIEEAASYEFCEKILDFMEELSCKEIITLGGIGLPTEIKNPAVFGAVTDKTVLDKYKKYKGINFKPGQKIEAIVGASGLLLGLAQLRNLKGISLLAETYANQYHLGFKEAKVLLEKLQSILDIKLNLNELEKEINFSEKQRLSDLDNSEKLAKKFKPSFDKSIRYIG